MTGPLNGLKVIEFTGLGPAPLAGQLLADMGASVIAIDRRSGAQDKTDINRRGKRSLALNLKTPEGVDIVQRLCADADILIEGFRPGVMEKLGLGPDDLPDSLIYGRLTGWGQTGPNAQTAGHDINYLSLTGALHAIGPADAPPIPPLNLAADYAGGTMFFLLGVLSAVYERQNSAKGQVVDAAMIDGVSSMMGLFHMLSAKGLWTHKRADNLLDGGAPFYRCYETQDGRYMAVGAIEPQFFKQFLELAGLPDSDTAIQHVKPNWPDMRARYAAAFKTKSQKEWTQIFLGSDACVSPVLSLKDAPAHPHMYERDVITSVEGMPQPATAPRFSRSAAAPLTPPSAAGAHSVDILAELGLSAEEIANLKSRGVMT